MAAVFIKIDDGGLVDVEHVMCIAKLQEGWTIEEVNNALKRCERPAQLRELTAANINEIPDVTEDVWGLANTKHGEN